MKLISPTLCLALVATGLFSGFSPEIRLSRECRAGEIDFGRDIRPILSDKCFQCHGADEASRGAELRLDQREIAIALRDGHAAIVPGKPHESLMIERICSDDPDVRMPPPDSNKSLTPAQMELLRAWVAQGAPYRDHWAFQPVHTVIPPAPLPTGWARNPIDLFIENRLHEAGLAPSSEADRYTQIRRLYQDLLGLLPTPDETREFVGDLSPDAYNRLVDRLLESPHYGERWGRHWLDQARYADSHGFTIDGARGMWPYRDWVIHAFNSDLPFDQFTIEQLAGDLLPQPTKTQRVATAFHRNTMINQEGGVKADQYRHEAIIDRVNTTGAVWLGLTIGCAQCHSHKFDPITHAEYYRLYAFFNGCQDANSAGATLPVYQNEILGWSDAEQTGIRQLQELNRQLQAAEKEADRHELERLKQLDWKWSPGRIADVSAVSNSRLTRLPDGSYRADQNESDQDTYRITFTRPASGLAAIRLRVLPDETLPGGGPGLSPDGNFLLTQVELLGDQEQKVALGRAWADCEAPTFPASAVLQSNPQTGWSLPTAAPVEKQQPSSAEMLRQPAELILQLGTRLDDKARKELTLILHHDGKPKHLIGRFAIDLSEIDPQPAKSVKNSAIKQLQNEIAAIENQLPGKGRPEQLMVMADIPEPPLTYLLKRGDFLQPAQDQGALLPGVPAALTRQFTVPPELKNRFDLAKWLVSRDNPLTARVAINRIWMQYFGRGLVETENDFGFQGSPPTHPELLDWLASEFMQHWSMKQIHRLIVTSATYRQSSWQESPGAVADPGNLLLGRQSRLRVDAETIRDLALSASGKLAPRLGGPSVFPPQPDGVYAFTQTKKVWTASPGADRYRRTLYTMFYRSAPHPLLTAFDSPDFSAACTQRPRSNTPLQSLTLANDVIFVELARGLAERVLTDLPPPAMFSDQMNRLFERCLTRPPAPAEQVILTRFWSEEQTRFSQDRAQADLLVGGQMSSPLEVPALAAWISTARVLMNTDEFITRN